MLRMATVCSGVGAPEVAYHDLFKSVWCCEFDKFPSAVLAERFPSVPNLGDMTKLNENPIYLNEEIDLLVGGTPCQGFSVAGSRKGLENDDRAKLALEFVEILRAKQPKWFIWENVPGVFSTGGGEDFKAIIEAFTNVGYGVSWRVLDAQHFGVPQRRRRVFVVGHLGDWRPSQRVLFESESLRGNVEEGGEKRKRVTAKPSNRFGETNYSDKRRVWQYGEGGISSTLSARDHKDSSDLIAKSLSENQRAELALSDMTRALSGGGGKPGQGYPCIFEPRTADGVPRISKDGKCPTLNTMGGGQSKPCISNDSIVRKLTPLECERLQGFPDNWTKIPYRNKDAEACPKGPRYKAMGNSMAVPVMRWIGERLAIVDAYMCLQCK